MQPPLTWSDGRRLYWQNIRIQNHEDVIVGKMDAEKLRISGYTTYYFER